MTPTARTLRRALEALDSAVIAEPRRPLLALTLTVAGDACRYNIAGARPLAASMAGGLRSLGGDGWRDLTGQPALELVRLALDAAEGMGR
jgi:hypothetical protein